LEKEADIQESHGYYPQRDVQATEPEDGILQRLLDRVNSLSSEASSCPPQEPKPSAKELEDRVLAKLVEKLHLLQPKAKPTPKKPTVASLSLAPANQGKRKGKGAKKGQGMAAQQQESAMQNQETPNSTLPPTFQQMHYPYFSGPMMPPFPAPSFYPYPPPGYGNQVPLGNQPPAPQNQNQGN